jgi:hypothetical protein
VEALFFDKQSRAWKELPSRLVVKERGNYEPEPNVAVKNYYDVNTGGSHGKPKVYEVENY